MLASVLRMPWSEAMLGKRLGPTWNEGLTSQYTSKSRDSVEDLGSPFWCSGCVLWSPGLENVSKSSGGEVQVRALEVSYYRLRPGLWVSEEAFISLVYAMVDSVCRRPLSCFPDDPLVSLSHNTHFTCR